MSMPGTDAVPSGTRRALPLLPAGTEGSRSAVAGALKHRLDGTVRADTLRFDELTRAAYTTDASNYRQVPVGVALPHSAEEVEAIVAACRVVGVPVTLRGGGTSVAGNSIGTGLVIDTSRHLDRIVEVDPERREAIVEPGVVLDDLRRAAAVHGLTFGPDPSTHSRCTLGGMIGNNACGSHSVAWGRTAENVTELDVLLADGARFTVGAVAADELASRARRPGTEGRVYRGLTDLLGSDGATIREHLRPWARRVSGYGLEHLLPEHGHQVARALVGTEGSCVTVLGATVSLVEVPAARALAVLGFESDEVAADATGQILPLHPLTVEGIDRRLVELVRPSARPEDLPPGGAWLLVEMGGASLDEAEAAAAAVARAVDAQGSVVVREPAAQRVFWKLREEGAGTMTRTPAGAEAWPGWEDAAVPPERLGGYLREFNALQRAYNLHGVSYGHFGEGCIHVRLDFDLRGTAGRSRFRGFLEDAADLVAQHGGSLSGEHGDGRARSELLGRMYPETVLTTFARFKGVWDPANRLNPGIIVDPLPMDTDLRLATSASSLDAEVTFAYPDDDESFSQAVHRCVGVGKCRSLSGAAMCPSYQVTRDERHSTRGRARLLQEMMAGEFVTDGWRSTEVRDALDLCLSCKACSSDCPVDVDIATYKSEFLSHHYAGRLRPPSHYSMGWLPALLRAAQVAPGLGNALLGRPGIARVAKRLGGIAPERDLPALAPRSFTASFRTAPATPGSRGPVVLWPDSFTNYLAPEIGVAATRVLESLGFQVVLPSGGVCCGLTWITTGQLATARRVLERSVRVLEHGPVDVPIIGLEPSCTVALQDDLPRLVPGADAAKLAARVETFASFVDREAEDDQLPRLGGRTLAQPHCHQDAAVGFEADQRLLQRTGVDASRIDPSCCGLAGNFGFEAGHYQVSQAVGERTVLPAVRAAGPDTTILADGFSCRTQIEQGTDRRAVHLAQLLAAGLSD